MVSFKPASASDEAPRWMLATPGIKAISRARGATSEPDARRATAGFAGRACAQENDGMPKTSTSTLDAPPSPPSGEMQLVRIHPGPPASVPEREAAETAVRSKLASDPDSRSARAALDNARELNDSAIPAALCATTYAANCWAFDIAAGLVDPMSIMGAEQIELDPSGPARALLLARKARAVELPELEARGLRLRPGESLRRGAFRSGALGLALVAVVDREDGSREAHLCVRGTDFNNHADPLYSAFRALAGYFVWTYPRIEKHAQRFKPLARALSEMARDPALGIDRVVISGHSLGGAAAQDLARGFPDCGKPVKLHTFGSPGSGSGWAAPASIAARAARSALAAAASSAADFTARMHPAFSALCARVAQSLTAGSRPPDPVDEWHYRHPNDPVPMLGWTLLYPMGTQFRPCMTPSEYRASKEGRALGVRGFGAHSCSRYFDTLHAMLDRSLLKMRRRARSPIEAERVAGIDAFEALRDLAQARREALRIEERATPRMANGAVLAARAASARKLMARGRDDPSAIRLEKLPEPRMSASAIAEARALRREALAAATLAALSSAAGQAREPAAPRSPPARATKGREPSTPKASSANLDLAIELPSAAPAKLRPR